MDSNPNVSGSKVEVSWQQVPSVITEYIRFLAIRHKQAQGIPVHQPHIPQIAVTIDGRYCVATVVDAQFDTDGICRSLCLKIAADSRPNNRDFFVVLRHDDYLTPPRWGVVDPIGDEASCAEYNARTLRQPFPHLLPRER